MTARLVLADLPEDVRAAIARGERINVYDNGHLAATVVPAAEEPDHGQANARDYRELMKDVPPLDSDFEKDIQETLTAVLRPQSYPWA